MPIEKVRVATVCELLPVAESSNQKTIDEGSYRSVRNNIRGS